MGYLLFAAAVAVLVVVGDNLLKRRNPAYAATFQLERLQALTPSSPDLPSRLATIEREFGRALRALPPEHQEWLRGRFDDARAVLVPARRGVPTVSGSGLVVDAPEGSGVPSEASDPEVRHRERAARKERQAWQRRAAALERELVRLRDRERAVWNEVLDWRHLWGQVHPGADEGEEAQRVGGRLRDAERRHRELEAAVHLAEERLRAVRPGG